jgi:hypothetical protein
VCSGAKTALLAAIKGCSNASMTGPMNLAIRDGEVGQVASRAPMNVVMDVNLSPGRTTYVATNLSFGGTVEIAPTWLPDQNRIDLLAVAHSAEFRGYGDPANILTITNNATGLTAVIPMPMFRVDRSRAGLRSQPTTRSSWAVLFEPTFITPLARFHS